MFYSLYLQWSYWESNKIIELQKLERNAIIVKALSKLVDTNVKSAKKNNESIVNYMCAVFGIKI